VIRLGAAAAALAVMLTSVLIAAAAWAAAAPAPRVVLVRPPAAPASVAEALVRLRGELLAAGFEAEVVELPLGADVRESLERLMPPTENGASATALVAVVASADPGSAELWVIDRVTGKAVVRRVNAGTADSSRAAEVLAVRAVELLRASFLELAVAPPNEEAPSVPTAPAVERWATAPLEESDWTWAVEAGGATAMAVNGPWNAFLPVGRLERAFGNRLCVRLAFAGLGTTAHVTAPQGSADVSQNVLLAEAVVRFRHGRRLEPLLSLGGGVMWLNVDGQQMSPNQGVSSMHWAAVGDLGIGMRIPLRHRRFEIGLEAHALLSQPYLSVQYFGQQIGIAGQPTVMVTLTLLGGV
jgi:hypothetical protein